VCSCRPFERKPPFACWAATADRRARRPRRAGVVRQEKAPNGGHHRLLRRRISGYCVPPRISPRNCCGKRWAHRQTHQVVAGGGGRRALRASEGVTARPGRRRGAALAGAAAGPRVLDQLRQGLNAGAGWRRGRGREFAVGRGPCAVLGRLRHGHAGAAALPRDWWNNCASCSDIVSGG